VTRKTPPRLGSGYFFRKNGKGWDLRANVYETDDRGERRRKQRYFGYLSQESWREMSRKNPKQDGLQTALETWVRECINQAGV
jgi:hypothetical protein